MIKAVSLETAKLLKESGFRHNTEFYWRHSHKTYKWVIEPKSWIYVEEIFDMELSAPTTDELLEELPFFGMGMTIVKNLEDWVICCKVLNRDFDGHCESNKSLHEALAQMWLWLKKEGLI